MKRILSVLALCALLLCGCGTNNKDETPEEKTQNKENVIDSKKTQQENQTAGDSESADDTVEEDVKSPDEEIDEALGEIDYLQLYFDNEVDWNFRVESQKYSRKLDLTEDRAKYYGELYHFVDIPRIENQSDNVNKLNQKILEDSSWCIENAKHYNDAYIEVSYDWELYNGVISILVNQSVSYLESEISYDAKGYYYDKNNDKILSVEDFISMMNIDRDKLMNLFYDYRNTYGTIVDEPSELKCVYVDENKAVFTYYGVVGHSVKELACDINNLIMN